MLINSFTECNSRPKINQLKNSSFLSHALKAQTKPNKHNSLCVSVLCVGNMNMKNQPPKAEQQHQFQEEYKHLAHLEQLASVAACKLKVKLA